MSSLTTTSINTANGATPLTLGTGNTSGPSIIVSSGTDITVKGNTNFDIVTANSSILRANTPVTVANTLTVTGQTTLNAVANGANFAGNTTLANVVATTVTTTNAVISSNSLTFGTSSIATSGYTRLPNGLLLQWGSATAVGTGGQNVTFPVPFAAAPYCVTVTSKTLGTPVYGAAGNTSTSSFTIDSSGTSDYFYMAIGT